MDRICIVCGTVFNTPPSSKKITCSRPCSTKRKRESHLGKSNVWSDESKAALSALGKTPNLKHGPKRWRLRQPNGKAVIINDLAAWCKANAASFGLRPEQLWWQMNKASKRRSLYKKWAIEPMPD